MRKKVLIRGAGDLASGIALRLHRSGFAVAMTETGVPTTVRRTVAFSPAVYLGSVQVEDVTGTLCHSVEELEKLVTEGKIPVLVDEKARTGLSWKPEVVVDAILAKRNTGTRITDAATVIGVGPGFTAGVDCHCVVESKRGHYLGRCIWEGSAIPNTGVPGLIGGFGIQRLLRAPADGIFRGAAEIGDQVEAGQVVGFVESGSVWEHPRENKGLSGEEVSLGVSGQNVSGSCQEIPMTAQISGVVRGLLQDGVPVTRGMKAGDVDPRCERDHCFTVSDKARAIGGGVLEAILGHEERK